MKCKIENMYRHSMLWFLTSKIILFVFQVSAEISRKYDRNGQRDSWVNLNNNFMNLTEKGTFLFHGSAVSSQLLKETDFDESLDLRGFLLHLRNVD